MKVQACEGITPTQEEWTLAAESHVVLEPAYKATQALQGVKTCPPNKAFLVVYKPLLVVRERGDFDLSHPRARPLRHHGRGLYPAQVRGPPAFDQAHDYPPRGPAVRAHHLQRPEQDPLPLHADR